MGFAPLGEDRAREHGRGRRAWVGLGLGCRVLGCCGVRVLGCCGVAVLGCQG